MARGGSLSASEFKASELSALVLAYLGDAVWEGYVRRRLINESGISSTARALHNAALKLVSAGAQAAVLKEFGATLTGEELAIMKRGRRTRARRQNRPSSMSEYRNSTGFEALLGYLDISGSQDRLNELMSLAFDLEMQHGRKEGLEEAGARAL
jgi:ribonuclease-3 family protein